LEHKLKLSLENQGTFLTNMVKHKKMICVLCHPWDNSSKGQIVKGTNCQRDILSKGHIIQGTHHPRTNIRGHIDWGRIKGTVSRNLLLQVFIMNHLPLSPLFGSVRTERNHFTNPQLAWHSYSKEPVAVGAVTLHSSHPNAGMKQYECGRTQPLL
jgi:hypothetical protein